MFCLITKKTRIQGPEGHIFRNTSQTLIKIWRDEGLLAFYRGFGAFFVAGMPGTVIYLSSYEAAKDVLADKVPKHMEAAAHFCSGMIAEACCCVLFVPVDVIKERLQVQRVHSNIELEYPIYNNSFDACRKILKSEGVQGIYKGYFATLLSYGPYSGLYFVLYEKTKNLMSKTYNVSPKELSFLSLLASATFSAATASWITNPLELVKLRLQVQRAEESPDKPRRHHYTGMADGLKKIYRSEGIRGLYRGAGARVAFQAPNFALTISLFDSFTDFFRRLF